MNQEFIIAFLRNAVNTSPGNRVPEEVALLPELADLRLFDEPLVGLASASDPLFARYQEDPAIIGSHYRTPAQWLPGAKTVISYFLPFTKEVRASNARYFDRPSFQWLHARIEGQAFLSQLSLSLARALVDAGFDSVALSSDPRFQSWEDTDGEGVPMFSSNWSERHAAYAAGLGTFGLSRGLITRKGTAGRFGSVITALELPADSRGYDNPYAYCLRCGKCGRNCPAGAIPLDGIKEQLPCCDFMNWTKREFSPRYGCGKCQVAVPCEAEIPQDDGSSVRGLS